MRKPSRGFVWGVSIVLMVFLAAVPAMGQPPIENPDPDPGGNGSGPCASCYQVFDQQGNFLGYTCHRPSDGSGRYRYCEAHSNGCNTSGPSGQPGHCNYV